MNKTAKEMFEKLGYYLDKETCDGTCIMYCYNILNSNTFGFEGTRDIIFDLQYKEINLGNKTDLLLEELQAINKQVEELGWSNENNRY